MADIAFEDYLDTLDEDELDDVLWAIDPMTSYKLRFNEPLDTDEDVAVDTLDEILANAPGLDKPMTLFTAYNSNELRQGGELIDAGFISGTEQNGFGADAVVLAIQLDKGTKALYLDNGVWVLPRGLKLQLRAAPNGPIPTKIVG